MIEDPAKRVDSTSGSVRTASTLLRLSAAHAALALGLSWMLRRADDSVLGSLLAYAPRWPLLVPAAALVPWALLARHRRATIVALATAVWIAGPAMGLHAHWRGVAQWLHGDGRPRADRADASRLRVVTCNADFRLVDNAALTRFLDQVDADLVVFQEAWTTADASLRRYPYVRRLDQYLVGSRFPLDGGSLLAAMPGGINPPAVHFDVRAPFGTLRLFAVHLMSPRDGIMRAITGRGLADLKRNVNVRRSEAAAILREASEATAPLLIVGDFNTPPVGALHRAFRSRYTDAFEAVGAGYGFTHYTKRSALRIDHVLTSEELRPRGCYVGPFVGAEHRPVVVDLSWVGSAQAPTATPAVPP